ncbi:MAG TPA: MBL fold metallo-hydrolase [Saprospiraceae bacterium]|nr:MBL fold metallo-hydrolase [Saprospiraceae bacterium]
MKLIFLGTGTSQGVPVIGCDCHVCVSTDPKDKRFRTSAYMESEGSHIVIDVSPDFRSQMLAANIKKVDAILFTHEHNDHVAGLDDVRPFNFMDQKPMKIFGEQRVIDDIKNRFAYVFNENPYPGAPRVDVHTIEDNTTFKIEQTNILPVRIHHGKLPILGYRIENTAYLTDVKQIPESEFAKLQDLEVLIISALRIEPHYSHNSLSESLEIIKRLKPQKAYLTHMSHHIGRHVEIQALLPENVFAAYDGLTLEV